MARSAGSALVRRCAYAAAFVVAIGAAAIASPHVAFAEELVEFPPGATVLTLPAQVAATLDVPFESATGVDPASLSVDLIDVTLDGVVVGAEPEDSEAMVRPEVDAELERLRLRVEVAAFDRVGTYSVTLRLRSGDVSQLVVVALNRQAAAITVPDVVELERTVWFPELGGDGDVSEPNVRVRNGADSLITELDAIVADPDAEGLEFAAGSENELVTAGDPLLPRERVDLDVELTARTPLGSIDRTVVLESPQLGEPVTVVYRITTRRSPVLIPILVVLGVLFGLLARRLPAWVAERAALERDRAATLTQITELVERYPAGEVRSKLLHQTQRLGGWKLKNADRRKLLDEVTAAANAVIAEVERELVPLRQQYAALEAPLRVDWRLPREAAAAFAAAQTTRRGVARHLRIGDVDAARSGLARLERQLGDLGADDLHAPRQALDRIGAAMTAALTPLDEMRELSTFVALENAADQIAEHCAAPLAADGALADRLRTLHDVFGAAERFTDRLRLAAHDVRTRSPGKTDDGGEQYRLLERVLADGDVDRRIDRMVPALTAAVATFDVKHGAAAAAARTAPLGRTSRPSIRRAESVEQTARVHLAERAASRWATVDIGVEALRFAILTGLLVAVSFKWFEPDWTGTLANMSTVLVWAFGVDVTTELITQVTLQRPAGLAAVDRAGSDQAAEPVEVEPVAEEPVVDEPAGDEPVVDEPAGDEPVVDEPAVGEPAAADEPTEDPDPIPGR